MSWPRFSSGQPTHGIGELGTTTEYARLIGKPRTNAMVDPELVPVFRRAGWLFLSPLVLLIGWLASQAGIRDMILSTQGWVLGLWTLVTVTIALSQMTWTSKRLIGLRMILLALLIGATVGVAAGYAWIAQTAHADARPGQPQRAFIYLAERSKMRGLIPAKYGFQLADGSNLTGGRKRKRFDYGSCVTVRLLTGSYGFRWVRVIESTPPPGPGQLHWPVRREDCFSDKLLSEVKR